MTSHQTELRRIRRILRAVCIVLAIGQAWVGRHTMNPDGISYLDIGTLYASHQWSAAVNAYWSPLYSWVLGILLAFEPTPRWEFPLVHGVNLLIFLAALASFEWLVSTLIHRYAIPGATADHASPGRTRLWLVVFAYGTFGWSTLHLVTVTLVNPDLLVYAILFVVATLVLHIQAGRRLTHCVALGAVLGLGYLAKSVFIVTAAGVFLLLPLSMPSPRIRAMALAALSFLAVAGPFIAAISGKMGRLTTGEAGRLNYLWQVSQQQPPFRHWQGEPTSFGVPVHSTRRILSDPDTYEFAEPVGGTYGVWLDPSYWFEGVKAPFSFTRQVDVVLEGVKTLAALCGPLIVALGVLLWDPGGPRRVLSRLRPFWTLLAVAGLGTSIYLLVWVEGRYIAPFVALGAILLAATTLQEGEASIPRLAAAISAVLVTWALLTVPSLVHGADVLRREWFGGRLVAVQPYRQAQGVRGLGIREGDRIATVGDGFYEFWARLAKVRIVAEVPTWEAPAFWAAEPGEQGRVYGVLARHGVRAVVTRDIPATASKNGWSAIEGGQFYVRVLPRPAHIGATNRAP